MKKVIASKVLFQIFPSLVSSNFTGLSSLSWWRFWGTSISWGCRTAPAAAVGLLGWGFIIPWLGLAWDLFPSLYANRASKTHPKKTSCVVSSSAPSSRVRFGDSSFPPCGVRRRESEGIWTNWNGGVLSCFLLPKNCARASLLLRSVRDWVVTPVRL